MSMIKCPHCGKDLPSESAFCPFCMEQLQAPVTVSVPSKGGRKRSESIIMIAVTVVLVVAVAVLSVSRFVGNKENVAPENVAGETELFQNQGAVQKAENNSGDVTTEPVVTTQEENGWNLWDRLTDKKEPDTEKNTPNTTKSFATKITTSAVSAPKASSTASTTKKQSVVTTQGTTVNNKRETTTASKTQSAGNVVTTEREKPTQGGNAVVVTTKPQTTQCRHNWVAQTETVYHEEEGHYEDVERSRAVTKYKCPLCYKNHSSLDLYYTHFDTIHVPSYTGDPITMFRKQYTTVTEYEQYTERIWVVDREAYDETVTTGHKCSLCGKVR